MADGRDTLQGTRGGLLGPLRLFWLCCALVLTACGPRTDPYTIAKLPETDGYLSAVPAGHTRYSNESLADVFVKLTHFFENGARAPGLYRFEQPITVGLVGDGAAQYRPFLQQVVTQIRDEAEIDLKISDGPVNILIRMIPGEQFLPHTTSQCHLIKGQPDWATFAKTPQDYILPTKVSPLTLSREGVFIPDTIEPYKVRQCILEELVQTLGTSNDLYGLSSSMFNDDEGHYWPTKLDYLMLRVLYDPELTTGRNPAETRKQARGILARLNPAGEAAPKLPPMRLHSFGRWRKTLHSLFDDDRDRSKDLQIARDLAVEARRRAPDSSHDCVGQTGLAYIMQTNNEDGVRETFDKTIETCTTAHGPDDIRVAKLKLSLANLDLRAGRHQQARRSAGEVLPTLKAYGHEDRVAFAKFIQTAASRKLEDPDWDRTYLPTAEAWVAYAYGDDHDLTEKLRR